MTFGMHFTKRSTLRMAAMASLLMALATTSFKQMPLQKPSAGESPTARINPEVRLRKLHLVRPDLIPYPIMYEVYC